MAQKQSTQDQSIYHKAVALVDAANSEDPNQEVAEGKSWPKELLYSHRMVGMLQRYKPDADDVMKLAIRSQHIQRWKSPRDAYPMDRIGYLQWRKDLYTFHAETAAELLKQAGYDEPAIDRLRVAVAKKQIKQIADTQLLEDTADLVFIEHYLQAFVDKHPEYDEGKWIDIIRKTWKKMSAEGQQFALSGSVSLPETLVPLIQKASGMS